MSFNLTHLILKDLSLQQSIKIVLIFSKQFWCLSQINEPKKRWLFSKYWYFFVSLIFKNVLINQMILLLIRMDSSVFTCISVGIWRNIFVWIDTQFLSKYFVIIRECNIFAILFNAKTLKLIHEFIYVLSQIIT